MFPRWAETKLIGTQAFGFLFGNISKVIFRMFASRDRIVVSTLRCGRNNPGSNPGHGRKIFNEKLISEHAKWQSSATSCLRTILFYTFL